MNKTFLPTLGSRRELQQLHNNVPGFVNDDSKVRSKDDPSDR